MDRIVDQRATLIARYTSVRAQTEALAAPLSPEDQQLQSMPDCSPTKWHRAHTTWFFETFLLAPRGTPPFDSDYGYLFNSYYEAVGQRHERPKRGLLSRPSCDEIAAYRRHVDARTIEWLNRCSDAEIANVTPLIELGLAHEEQHQELLLTDILNAFAANRLCPVYRRAPRRNRASSADGSAPLRWTEHAGGLVDIGTQGRGFAFDNEGPRHKVWLQPYALASRLVTVGEVKAFVRDGGYRTPSLWLSDGLTWVRENRIEAPLYARVQGDAYVVFGLEGEREAADSEAAAHLSFYEADAIATWLGARLPTEQEWENAAVSAGPAAFKGARLLDDGFLRAGAADANGTQPLFGGLWQWTRSAYEPYPGFVPPPGAIGEYNGKFMANQYVLRGGSFATPAAHIRGTYRNFWYPATRFQFTGVRLAKNV